jgi:hypothetical protein
LWYVRGELFKAVEMFMDYFDLDMKPRDIEDSKLVSLIYIGDKYTLRKIYKLKNL